jgi:hypothetical protein
LVGACGSEVKACRLGELADELNTSVIALGLSGHRDGEAEPPMESNRRGIGR